MWIGFAVVLGMKWTKNQIPIRCLLSLSACVCVDVLTQVYCSLWLCCVFLLHRSWNTHCRAPRGPIHHEPASCPSPYSHTCRACSAKNTQTHYIRDNIIRGPDINCPQTMVLNAHTHTHTHTHIYIYMYNF